MTSLLTGAKLTTLLSIITRTDQNTGGALLESPVRTAMHGKSRVLSAFVAVDQWVRRWSSNHTVVQGEGSCLRGDV